MSLRSCHPCGLLFVLEGFCVCGGHRIARGNDRCTSLLSRGREVVMVLHFQVAGIDSDSGALLWRHAQETDQLGEVKALKVKL